MNVLVTDAENKNALAAIRSLGRRGVRVFAGSSRRLARGFYSAYAADALRYASPAREEAFVDSLLTLAQAHCLDVLLPIGDAANRVMSKHLDALTGAVAVPVAPWSAMKIASSKRLSAAFAQEHGVGVPRTYEAPDEVDAFPVVVKASLGAGGVRYVNDRDQLNALDTRDAVIQEWIPGEGYGFFALFDRGRERAVFMHRRLREYPVTGGASTAAISIYDRGLEELGLRLLRALQWHGVAMVEVKKDARDGRFKLMEINPKFWGSLDLSIAAGVDFPWAAVQMALGRLDGGIEGYERCVRFQWVFDDFMHMSAQPRAAREFWRDLRDPAVGHDVTRDDVRPAVFDGAKTLALIARRAASRTLRRPHGEPLAPRPR